MNYRLSDLHREGPPPLPAADRWPAARQEIAQIWQQLAGHGTHQAGHRVTTVATREADGYLEAEIVVHTADDTIPALLLTPTDHPGRNPAVLALHPTNPEGKRAVAGPDPAPNRGYGVELARRGYVVLAPDTITAGDRVIGQDEPYVTARHDREHPELSAVGKMINDHRHMIDVLESLGTVDPDSIGAIGHSLGGYNALFLSGADPRIAAAVVSCGFATFASDPQLHRWGVRDWFSHLPRLSPLLDQGMVPFEMHQIAALAAPRPLFLWLTTEDRIFPHWRPAWEAVQDLADLYDGLEAGNQVTAMLGNGGHDFPPEARAAAYAFLDRHLGGLHRLSN